MYREFSGSAERVTHANRISRFSALAALSVGALLAMSTTGGKQDITTMVMAGAASGGWANFLQESPAGSTHSAELVFGQDPITTGSIDGNAPRGAEVAGLGQVAFRQKTGSKASTPDESRIVKQGKSGRLVKVAPVSAPKGFSAGSILQRHSMMAPAEKKQDVEMAFYVPKTDAKSGLEIAMAFYQPKPKPVEAKLPVMLASLPTTGTSDVLATAYAPTPITDFARQSPFTGIIQRAPAKGRFIAPRHKGDHAWVKNVLPKIVFSKKEQKCLAIGIYFEARGEPVKGQAAVAQVILNRVRNPTYPDTICGVVYQNDHWRNRCQFSFACDGIRDTISSPKHWDTAVAVASSVTAGKIWLDSVGSSTHYHATYVSPKWAPTMKRLVKIGQHIFYRTYNGGWS